VDEHQDAGLSDRSWWAWFIVLGGVAGLILVEESRAILAKRRMTRS
jgi:hypothetical protein